MILNAFYVNVHNTKDETPQKVKNKKECAGYGAKKVKQIMWTNWVPRPPALAGGPGGATPREEKKEVFPVYTLRLLTPHALVNKGNGPPPHSCCLVDGSANK